MDYMRQHDHGGDDDESGESCPMIMTLHAGSCEAILFKNLQVKNAGEMVLAAALIFVVAVAYEGLRFLREKLYMDYMSQQQTSCSNTKVNETLLNRKTIRQLITNKMHLIQTGMHIIQVTVSYALMLIVMTYNVWLVLAVIFGATVGYFFFGWIRQRAIDVADSCCQ